jgi:hypothetical protein
VRVTSPDVLAVMFGVEMLSGPMAPVPERKAIDVVPVTLPEPVMEPLEVRFTVAEETLLPREMEPLVAVMEAVLMEVTVLPVVEEKESLARRVTEPVELLPMEEEEEMSPVEAVNSIVEPVTGAETVSAGAVRLKSEPAEEVEEMLVVAKVSLTRTKPLALAEMF